MGSLNRAILCGNIGKDAECRYTGAGTAVASFSLATSERYTDKDGNKKENTEWHRVVVWGKQAETLTPYLTKGSLIAVEGRIATRSWTNKDNQKHYTTEVIAQHISLLRTNKAEDAAPTDRETPKRTKNPATSAPASDPWEGGGPPPAEDPW